MEHGKQSATSSAPLTISMAIERWRQTFGEPPPIMANAGLMAEIINDHSARQNCQRNAEGAKVGSC